jgi:hypothetical protein
MATPIGHALAGIAVTCVSPHRRLDYLILGISMAVAPDLDILPGMLLGTPVIYHGGITHSFGFALLVSLAAAVLFALRGEPFLRVFKFALIAYSTHLVLDFVGPDGREPLGIPLFWPLLKEHFLSPIPLLLGVRHAADTAASTGEFLEGVFSLHNIAAIAWEAVLIGPIIWYGWRRSRLQLPTGFLGQKKG